jgi:hypothetical protein
MTWVYKPKELEVKTVLLKCRGCGAKIKVALMEGECTSEIIIGCDKCTKKLNHWEEYQ